MMIINWVKKDFLILLENNNEEDTAEFLSKQVKAYKKQLLIVKACLKAGVNHERILKFVDKILN